jgi:hypothetical protein
VTHTPTDQIIAYETESHVADLTIATNISTFRLPSEIAMERLGLLRELRDAGEIVSTKAKINFVFPEQSELFFRWLAYGDDTVIHRARL